MPALFDAVFLLYYRQESIKIRERSNYVLIHIAKYYLFLGVKGTNSMAPASRGAFLLKTASTNTIHVCLNIR